MMKNWMAELASHYETIRNRYPQDRLLILFDIDGTILDMRYMVWHMLCEFDRCQNTELFKHLAPLDIDVHENYIEPLLQDMALSPLDQQEILAWFTEQAWTSDAILEAHRPFGGVLEVIRWFQLQTNTDVGLNTARGERLREDTLRSLNKLGGEFKIHFTNDLLYMMPEGWTQGAPAAKIAGVERFRDQGYRVFAFIDNEPDNLEGVAQIDPDHEILLLHADTIFRSKRTILPPRAIGGKVYNLTDLITQKSLPHHIQFVWSGIQDLSNLKHFLASDVYWGEFEISSDQLTSDANKRARQANGSDYSETGVSDLSPEWLERLDYVMTLCQVRQKGLKLNLKAGGKIIDQVWRLVEKHQFQSSRLWFNVCIETWQADEFKHLARLFPEAIIESPIEYLAAAVHNAPIKTKALLDKFQGWGINRFAIPWQTPKLRHFFDQMDQWGFEINVYDIPDLEAFLRAVLLMPQSITSDFNFPKWHYFGRPAASSYRQLDLPHVVDAQS